MDGHTSSKNTWEAQTIFKKEEKKRAQSRVCREGYGHGRNWKKSKYQNESTKTSKGIHFPTHKSETLIYSLQEGDPM